MSALWHEGDSVPLPPSLSLSHRSEREGAADLTWDFGSWECRSRKQGAGRKTEASTLGSREAGVITDRRKGSWWREDEMGLGYMREV